MMTGGADGARRPSAARLVADAVPALVAELRAAGARRLHREALERLERPLLEHALALTGGNQLRAARLLGLNRNTLRTRCRRLAVPPRVGRPAARARARAAVS